MVEHAGKLRTIQFHRGQAITADSEAPENNLVQVFLDRECFTLENYLQVSANFSEGQSLGESMVQFGLITKAELAEGRKARVFRVFKSILGLAEGQYRFDAVQPGAISAGPSLDFPRDFFRAFLAVENRAWVLDQMDANLAFRVAPQAPIPQSVWEDEEMADLINVKELLTDQLDFKALVLASSAETFRLLKFLRMAEMLGYVKLVPTVAEDAPFVEAAVEGPVMVRENLPPSPPATELPSTKSNSRRWGWVIAGGLGMLMVAVFVWTSLQGGQENTNSEPPVKMEIAGNERSPETADVEIAEISKPQSSSVPEDRSPASIAMAKGEIDLAARLWHEASVEWAGQFTLGIFMVCDPANASKLWGQVPNEKKLFILPHRYQGQPCYWVCWGQYATRLEALTARSGLPHPVLASSPDAEVYPISNLR